MKSIQNQYIDLKEGRMSQHNFMRNLRMSMPQYITNVTSFKDAVRILKNKSILTEMYDGSSEPIANSKTYYADSQDRGETGSRIKFEVVRNTPEYFTISYVITPNSRYSRGGSKEGDVVIKKDPSLSAYQRKWIVIPGSGAFGPISDELYNMLYDTSTDDSELDDMINRIEDEESGKYTTGDRYRDDIYEVKKKKAKKEEKPYNPNVIHPGELRMGIKVELEHTDDLNKAKKIALDHLAENPYYYTALKLSGIESPSAPKAKPPVAAKKVKKKDATEMVDIANQMQKVKMPKKVVNEVRINAMPGEETNATMKHAMQYIDSDIANPTLKALSDRLELQPLRDNRAILRYGYWEKMPAKALDAVKLQFNVEEDIDSDEETAPQYIYIISSKKKSGNLGSSLETGANKASQIDAFKEALEKLVRETLAETFDGRDDLANITDYTK